MNELKELYIAPDVELLRFKALEWLANGDGNAEDPDGGITFPNEESGGENEDYDGE